MIVERPVGAKVTVEVGDFSNKGVKPAVFLKYRWFLERLLVHDSRVQKVKHTFTISNNRDLAMEILVNI